MLRSFEFETILSPASSLCLNEVAVHWTPIGRIEKTKIGCTIFETSRLVLTAVASAVHLNAWTLVLGKKWEVSMVWGDILSVVKELRLNWVDILYLYAYYILLYLFRQLSLFSGHKRNETHQMNLRAASRHSAKRTTFVHHQPITAHSETRMKFGDWQDRCENRQSTKTSPPPRVAASCLLAISNPPSLFSFRQPPALDTREACLSIVTRFCSASSHISRWRDIVPAA